MYDLTALTLGDTTACGAALHALGAGAASMEEVAGRTVRYLYDHLRDGDGARATALVQHMDALRYADAEQGKKMWRAACEQGQEIAGVLIPTRLEVIRLDEGTPWLAADIENVIFNVPVQASLQNGEAAFAP